MRDGTAGGLADRWSPGPVLLRAAGNLLLGVALGLMAQYAITDVVNASDQAALSAEMTGVSHERDVASAGETPRSPVLDLAGWESEDAAYWAALAEGGPFARIVIARIGLDAVVVKGSSPRDLKAGPGWIQGTDMPGGTGNTGIAGHRTTYGSPFGRIDELVAGDTASLYSPYRQYVYEVVRTLVVTPDQVEVIAHTDEPMLTLSACHPRFSARYRYIVQARLVRVRRAVPEGSEGR